MDIIFKDKELEKCAESIKYGTKKMGALRYRQFTKRIQDLVDTESLEDLRYAPGHFHELTADRKGQISCSVEQPYRLIIKPVSVDVENGFNWSDVYSVEIIEIVNYHGK